MRRLSRNIGRWFNRNIYGIYIGVLIILLFGLVFWKSIFISIMPGERGVIWSRFGGGTDTETIYNEGLRVIAPWDIMYIYDTRIQEVTDTVDAIVQGGITLQVEYSLHFKPEIDSLGVLHKEIGPDYIEKILVPEASSAARVAISDIDPDSVYNFSREEVQDSMMARIRREVSIKHVTFLDVMIRSIQLPDTVVTAINSKIAEEQRYKTYIYKLAAERKEAERKLIEARGIKEFEDTSGISILKWQGLGVTSELAHSPN